MKVNRICKVCSTNVTPHWRKDKVYGDYFCNRCGIKNSSKKKKINYILPDCIKHTLKDTEDAYKELLKVLK